MYASWSVESDRIVYTHIIECLSKKNLSNYIYLKSTFYPLYKWNFLFKYFYRFHVDERRCLFNWFNVLQPLL